MELPIQALIVGLFSLCSLSSPPSPPEGLGGDCGVFAADGQDCFEAAMRSCSPATVMFFDGVPPVRAEIEGASIGASCSLTLHGISKAEVERTMLDNYANQREVDEMNAKIDAAPGFSSLEGKTATCVVEKLKADVLAKSYVYMCSGPLIDEIRRLGLAEKFE